MPAETVLPTRDVPGENHPCEVIATRLAQDPNLTPAAAESIAEVVRELYWTLAKKNAEVTVHLRAAKTFTPRAAKLLGEILSEMQHQLESGSPRLGRGT
ncbi:hypothetical protein K8Z49_01395 [Actinomadura madurae]|uniref:hypothetical protein n=1 Tax=Actinomadura madurae TaxID=1993 RepID=UPI00399B803D